MSDKTRAAENEAIRKKYPQALDMVVQVFCGWCIHRGYREGCKFDLLPLTIEGKVCPMLEGWGRHKRNSLVKDAKQLFLIHKAGPAAAGVKA